MFHYAFIARDVRSLLLAGLPALRKSFPLHPKLQTYLNLADRCLQGQIRKSALAEIGIRAGKGPGIPAQRRPFF